MRAAQDPIQQRDAMANGEERHVDAHVAQPVEEENDAKQKQQMIVAGDHVFGAEVDVRNQLHPGALLDERLVVLGNTVRQRIRPRQPQQYQAHR